MKIVSGITIFFNLISIIILLLGVFIKFKLPKNKATYGFCILGSMIPYLMFLSLYIVLQIFLKHNFNVLFLILFILSPFIIGKLVKYETLKKYTIVQIIFYTVSLVYLILIF